MTKLDVFINKNLPKVLAEHTVNSLGDRSTYIGASDIGGCLRSAYLGKKQKVDYDIAQHIVFERGHLTEGIVAKMLEGTPFKSQVEAIGKADNGFPIKAHLDFVVDFGKEVVIVEAKSTSNPIEQPYDSWVLQTQLQMWLLKNNKDYQGKPIRGYIIAIDVNSGWFKTFEVEPNGTLLNIALSRANTLSIALNSNKCPDGEIKLYCDRCPFKGDCEAVSNGASKQLPFEIKSFIGRLKELKATDKEIKKIKETVKNYMEATNTNVAKSDNTTVSLRENSGDMYNIDINRLRVEQPDIYAKYRIPAKKFRYIQVV